MTPLKTAVRFWVERSLLNLRDLQLQTFVNSSLKMFATWSVKITSGIPYFNTILYKLARHSFCILRGDGNCYHELCQIILEGQDVSVSFISHVGRAHYVQRASLELLSICARNFHRGLSSGDQIFVQLATLTSLHILFDISFHVRPLVQFSNFLECLVYSAVSAHRRVMVFIQYSGFCLLVCNAFAFFFQEFRSVRLNY